MTLVALVGLHSPGLVAQITDSKVSIAEITELRLDRPHNLQNYHVLYQPNGDGIQAFRLFCDDEQIMSLASSFGIETNFGQQTLTADGLKPILVDENPVIYCGTTNDPTPEENIQVYRVTVPGYEGFAVAFFEGSFNTGYEKKAYYRLSSPTQLDIFGFSRDHPAIQDLAEDEIDFLVKFNVTDPIDEWPVFLCQTNNCLPDKPTTPKPTNGDSMKIAVSANAPGARSFFFETVAASNQVTWNLENFGSSECTYVVESIDVSPFENKFRSVARVYLKNEQIIAAGYCQFKITAIGDQFESDPANPRIKILKSIYDWCSSLGSDFLDTHQDYLVREILKYTSSDSDIDCFEAQTFFDDPTARPKKMKFGPNLKNIVDSIDPKKPTVSSDLLRKVTHVGPLSHLYFLEELDLASNTIEDISPLRTLVNLKKLNLTGVRPSVESLEVVLENMVNIEELVLAANGLTEFPVPDVDDFKFEKLKILDLSINKISDLKNLKATPALEALVITGNQLVSLEGLIKTDLVREVQAPVNELVDIGVVGQLKKLDLLDIRYNDLDSDALPFFISSNFSILYNFKSGAECPIRRIPYECSNVGLTFDDLLGELDI